MNHIKIDPILCHSTEDWFNHFLVSPKERADYYKDANILRFQRVGLEILGIPLDEDEYYNSLFNMHQKGDIHVLSEELDKSIDNRDFKAIQEILEFNRQQPNGLSSNRLVAFMYGRNLMPKYKDPALNRHIQLTVIKVVEAFRRQYPTGLQSPEFRRFLIDMVKWMKNHLEKWTYDMELGDDFPKVVWYGDLTESQKYFLLLLMEFGCDCVIFHPEGREQLSTLDPANRLSVTYKYVHIGPIAEFPTQLRERQSTVAYRANKQLERLMNDHASGVYKPWQFRNHIPSSITMKMTYDDIVIYAKEKAVIRPEFKVENHQVHIPVIFAKVQGVTKNRKEYWNQVRELTISPLALTIKEFPFSKTTKANYHYHYQHSMDKGSLSPEKIIKGSWWPYKHVPIELQIALASKVKTYCEHPKLKKVEQESDYDLRLFLFKQAMLIPEPILRLLQKFDYSQDVPRLVLYNSETNGDLSREDAALLLFLNGFGLDIILYNPAGHNDIEKYIEPSHYDTHWLEEIVFNQEFNDYSQKKKSIFSKLFNRIY